MWLNRFNLSMSGPGNLVCPQRVIGTELAFNKQHVYNMCYQAGGTIDECALFIAMAMLETVKMNFTQRDASKDNIDGYTNIGLWNLNTDLLGQLNYTNDPWMLNGQTDIVVYATLTALLRGLRGWGYPLLLNFVRGGRTAFTDGVSFGAVAYRTVIRAIVHAIQRDPALLTDERRVECPLVRV